MNEVKIESSTDSADEVAAAQFQPLVTHEQTLTVIQRGKHIEGQGTEHNEPKIEVSSEVLPGRELRQDELTFARRAAEFQKEANDFSSVLTNSGVLIPESCKRELLRLPNGAAVAYGLALTPSLAAQLCAMNPIDAAKRVRELSAELESGNLGELNYQEFTQLRDAQSRQRRRR